jgi:hypothetical protein
MLSFTVIILEAGLAVQKDLFNFSAALYLLLAVSTEEVRD